MSRSPALLFLLAACGGPETPGLDTEFPDANDPAYAASLNAEVDPRVSTSAGVEGGIVVLWPRVIPASESFSGEAARVQERLVELVNRGRRMDLVDVRPEPERVCPSSGCVAASVGAVLLHTESDCAVVASVSPPGRNPARLVRWTADVNIRRTVVPFREPPEEHIDVQDFRPCSQLASALSENTADIEQALEELAPRGDD